MIRPLLMSAALALSGLATAAPYSRVDLTLKHELGSLKLGLNPQASPVLGVRNPAVRNGVAYASASSTQSDWQLGLSPKWPIDLHLQGLQSDLTLDLSGLPVRTLNLRQQLGDLRLTLPSGHLKATLTTTQSNVVIVLPKDVGVSVRLLRLTQGSLTMLGQTVVDGLDSSGTYQSPNYAAARYKADLTVTAELGDIVVK